MDEPYLITKPEAARRYNLSTRTLEMLYKRYKDFPVLRVGRKVLIIRDAADRWFSDWMGGTVEA